MSSLKDRAVGRLALVPGPLADRYAREMARLPRVTIVVRRPSTDRDLPAVGSFHG